MEDGPGLPGEVATTANSLSGAVTGAAVQAGTIGEVHVHGPATRPGDDWVVTGISTAVPTEPGPPVAHGREAVVADLLDRVLDPRPGGPRLLVGAGGMGKSTVAGIVARRAQREHGRRVWWISAVTEEHLSGGLVGLARDLGLGVAHQEAIRAHRVAGLGDVADLVWRRLERIEPGWLLVVDNADVPELLGPPDGTGWVRESATGLVLVTSRRHDRSSWPGHVEATPIGPLDRAASARVLLDLAPRAGDERAANALADRLGGLPLALRMAGLYLGGDFVAWPTFDRYRHAVDVDGVAGVFDLSSNRGRRDLVGQTWELSLDALAASGLPHARELLWLLACYAPGAPVPEELLTAVDPEAPGRRLLTRRLDLEPSPAGDLETIFTGLRGLASVGLAQRPEDGGDVPAVRVHPFIAEVTGAVMNALAPGDPRPARTRRVAVAAIGAAVDALRVGTAAHWPRFHLLTPHVHHLLAQVGPLLDHGDRVRLLDCVTTCATAYLWSRAERRAEDLVVRAMAVARDLGCHADPAYLRLRHVRGWALRELGEFAEAERVLGEVLAAQGALPGGADRPDTLHTRHDLAWTTGRRGDWAHAERELRAVRDRRRARPGLDHDDIDILHTRCMLCWSVGMQGRWPEAERGYRAVLADRAALIGADHPDTLDTRESLGKTLAWQGRWDEAAEEFHLLAAGRARHLGRRHPDALLARQLHAYAVGRLALARDDATRLRWASRTLRRTRTLLRDVRGPDHPTTAHTGSFLTTLAGRHTPALPWPGDVPRP
ncbi:tetratricopeptide repeat protein [Saccharothrix texasensis]|uniref:Tetratricopeptide repeat protein n=1 Tax=Saccharothrix texasensis TaxID=103734 RepID=A0A3N1H110_9PSEU|nr:tetratricopeptide repeat protein [Saccharothrix texasensis]ROP36174.1 tetratricopeptide repeat protein [Saccharothrix texasensis]